ncbi:MAG: undecaprenyldiphospho-muramoylpentapeptide beta-N-acetylglucosaminyltransferase [Rhodospirillales bacterium]|jgi:UDP-N-acetylglucosamine--N-acetylmuramyl-(pentapeptide) pyrophosphoryl-undecaprenol N-acetylglucosamine transferase|nr:undecaprenyldiphospho-muramoylpentapeptide beta-N-acetylglucosaminyltransferase [Rhodospirillales bacterium]HJO73270.1 undecaprenyldiphospho-muramoylpentapeptide beta-N-acetylglucosaminyltransferase [Rhodospirillales bacterium]
MTRLRAPLVVLAAGGTGGHVFPAEALAAELRARGCRIVLVTDRRGSALGGELDEFEIHRIRAGGVAGKSFAARLRSAPELAVGMLQARRLLKRIAPDVVVGFGGYASVPTMMAASFGGFQTVTHEQNAVLGRANRLLASRVARIATSFETLAGLPAGAEPKVVHTGMPIRPAVAAMRERPYAAIAETGAINILVLGGSQGARVFSRVVPEALHCLSEAWRRRLHVVQQCRPEDLDAVRCAYAKMRIDAEIAQFFADVPERLAEAHLLIGRAGASTVAEVLVVGRPAILVPYPRAIDDHQSANAHAVDAAGGGWLMPEDAFAPGSLSARLESLFELPHTLVKAASAGRATSLPDAARRLADTVYELMPNGESEDKREAA